MLFIYLDFFVHCRLWYRNNLIRYLSNGNTISVYYVKNKRNLFVNANKVGIMFHIIIPSGYSFRDL